MWIAKFPSRHDEENVEAWEMVVHELAAECGLNVPEAKLESFHDRRGTFLVKRFDRDGNRRIHFSSAMNLLGQTDGAVDAGYLDIASFIRSYGASPREDLAELWKRVVFSIAVSNTDDHLRNHGFLLTDSGWKLSPMYDVNPSIYGNLLSLAISREDATMDFDLAIDSAKYYDITSEKARSIVKEIKAVVSEKWKTIAKQCGLDRSAIVRMESAFAMECK
ncbi:MAG: HipA domain-containing protein [Lachnospiraceae bacterium]|nr:HipA domain-containing protein [Lachnospiraceae bacterium]